MKLDDTMIKAIITITLFANVLAKNKEYMGFKVYNVKLDNQTQQENLYKLKSDLVDFWKRPSVKYKVVGKAMVPPSHTDWFEEMLAEIGVEKDIYTEDVYSYLKAKDRESLNLEEEQIFDFDSYHRYDAILNHLYNLEDVFSDSPITVKLIEHSRTEEGRPIVYLKLTNGDDDEKPTVVIEAAINPRDWVTVPSALNVVNRLIDDENRVYLDKAIWIVIPVLNPDGYEYTHTNLRLWTKSRSHRSDLGFICPGVNIDRNFDIDWLISDSSSSPCSHLYAGVEPFSEPETQLIKTLIDDHNPRLYISLQNNGKLITFPWNYEKAASGLFKRHLLLGRDLVKAVEGYALDSGAMAIGDRVSGTSVDYARRSGAFYTYIVGVEGGGDDGVFVPEEDIKRAAEDVWKIVEVAASNL